MRTAAFHWVLGMTLLLGGIVLSNNQANASTCGNAVIARWFDNRDAAISLRFDDSLASHVDYVIPVLNRYGIKATFMVNPGLERYQMHRDFWERKVPAMGHELGNHTAHHRGARTIREAEREIGEVSELIWRLYPTRSRVTVFASGGGRRCLWGGRQWSDAAPEYKQLVAKYNLIDLYDGHHPATGINSRDSEVSIDKRLHDAINTHGHLPFVFHNIGTPTMLERMRALVDGFEATCRKEQFEQFLDRLSRVRNKVWIAPLTQILKYEHEYRNAKLEMIDSGEHFYKYRLIAAGDPMYDQELTVVASVATSINAKVYQGSILIKHSIVDGHKIMFNVRPVSSVVIINNIS